MSLYFHISSTHPYHKSISQPEVKVNVKRRSNTMNQENCAIVIILPSNCLYETDIDNESTSVGHKSKIFDNQNTDSDNIKNTSSTTISIDDILVLHDEQIALPLADGTTAPNQSSMKKVSTWYNFFLLFFCYVLRI